MTEVPRTSQPEWLCPDHRLPLSEAFEALECAQGHSFPVRHRIPRFVPDDGYSSAFGNQWKSFPLTQLDSHTGHPITATRLRRCLGDLWDNLRGATVLEVGCGAGRFTEILLAQGALVTSVDLSQAVEVNGANFPISGQHRIAQADVGQLPFADGAFDVVICLGVVQHTPSPEETIHRLAEQVRPGGSIVIDHYIRDWHWYTRSAPLIRALLRRLPPQRAMAVTTLLVNALYPIHKRVRSRVSELLLTRISPISYYNNVYPELSEETLREWSHLDTHDSLTDWFKHRRTVDEINTALSQAGVTGIWCEQGGNGVEARGHRVGATGERFQP